MVAAVASTLPIGQREVSSPSEKVKLHKMRELEFGFGRENLEKDKKKGRERN